MLDLPWLWDNRKIKSDVPKLGMAGRYPQNPKVDILQRNCHDTRGDEILIQMHAEEVDQGKTRFQTSTVCYRHFTIL